MASFVTLKWAGASPPEAHKVELHEGRLDWTVVTQVFQAAVVKMVETGAPALFHDGQNTGYTRSTYQAGAIIMVDVIEEASDQSVVRTPDMIINGLISGGLIAAPLFMVAADVGHVKRVVLAYLKAKDSAVGVILNGVHAAGVIGTAAMCVRKVMQKVVHHVTGKKTKPSQQRQQGSHAEEPATAPQESA
eukprot:CAMPEP_0202893482 /NCGR_PEP_ID=MMETSP1392-20130828/3057_1 /ASSEMBLY_ACC=CAM_ASM_000868 /TAXON_ID=225041 /ORGANISM="Chlamydomonas chlamydogama, Strain SAG 11-48b" /LENGTH=189 /DNA_ID=CAMNT_0049577831 /DNA_START=231 /DNA_END=800 /DNA_ORIENTATION=-